MTDRDRLHAPDPRDEVRGCPGCADCHFVGLPGNDATCDGRGHVVGRWVRDPRLGHAVTDWRPARSQDVIELAHSPLGFVYRVVGADGDTEFNSGEKSWDTTDEALLAARCAYWGVEITASLEYPKGWMWRRKNGSWLECNDGCHNPTAALCAAIDAREG